MCVANWGGEVFESKEKTATTASFVFSHFSDWFIAHLGFI